MRSLVRVALPFFLVICFSFSIAAAQSAGRFQSSSSDVREVVQPWLVKAHDAMTAIAATPAKRYHAELHAAIAVTHARMADMHEACRSIRRANQALQYVDDYDRWHVDRCIVRGQAWAGDDKSAFATILADDDILLPEWLFELAVIQSQRGDDWAAFQTFVLIEARVSEFKMDDHSDRNTALAKLAVAYARAGRWDQVDAVWHARTRSLAYQFPYECAIVKEAIRQGRLVGEARRTRLRELNGRVHFGCSVLIRRAAANVAEVHALAGDVKQAETWLQAVCRRYPRIGVLAHIAAAHQRSGRRTNALAALKRAMTEIRQISDDDVLGYAAEYGQVQALAELIQIVTPDRRDMELAAYVYQHVGSELQKAVVAVNIADVLAR